MRVTACTLALALEFGSEGLGACSLRSLPTLRVSVGLVLWPSGAFPTSKSSYSMPSSPREGIVTLGGRCGRSLETVRLRLAPLGGSFKGDGA